jgi:hypothetical protein
MTPVASTIIAQIRATDRYALASWGITGMSGRTEVLFDESGVQFCLARGRKVIVKLDAGSDLYEVTVGRNAQTFEKILGRRMATGIKWVEEGKVEGVYNDSLVRTIDSLLKGKRF